jgi:hypothetical protein
MPVGCTQVARLSRLSAQSALVPVSVSVSFSEQLPNLPFSGRVPFRLLYFWLPPTSLDLSTLLIFFFPFHVNGFFRLRLLVYSCWSSVGHLSISCFLDPVYSPVPLLALAHDPVLMMRL